MSRQVKVDRRGRIVIPQHERKRLGLATGGSLELIRTREGVLLELRRSAEVRIAADGLPVVAFHDRKRVTNEETLEVIHRERDRST